MDSMKVIVRREYDPYRKDYGYLAAFPEASTNPGNILCLPFHFLRDGSAIFECHTEASFSYYYKTKIVHAVTDEAKRCKAAIEQYYNSQGGDPVRLKLAEKII